MLVSGVVDATDRVSTPDTGKPAFRVMVIPDNPTAIAGQGGKLLTLLAFHVARLPDPEPDRWVTCLLNVGDRVTFPMIKSNGMIEVSRSGVRLPDVKMLGWVSDPDAPLT